MMICIMPSFLSACMSRSINPAWCYDLWCRLELAVPYYSILGSQPPCTAPCQLVSSRPLSLQPPAHLVAHWRSGSMHAKAKPRQERDFTSPPATHLCVLSPSHAWSDRPRKRIRATTKLSATALPVHPCTATEAAGCVPPTPRPSRSSREPTLPSTLSLFLQASSGVLPAQP